jgi:hypothetical protein
LDRDGSALIIGSLPAPACSTPNDGGKAASD